MIVYPAIDLMDGRCVRLKQGRFEEATVYASRPEEALARFGEAGAAWAHIVDLDGARAGTPAQHALMARLARGANLKLQVAGGFRSRDQVAHMLDSGAERVVIGSLAVESPDLVQAMIDEFGGERIALALDVELKLGVPFVATSGWTRASTQTVTGAAALYPEARHLLVTDIGRDGMLKGPNLWLVNHLVQDLPRFALQASGGTATLHDLRDLAMIGAEGAVIGRALWDESLDLAEAIRVAGA